MDERLVYGFDPLCGWCFAFRPTMAAIRAAHPDLPVQLAYGGLVVGERVAPISEMRGYLRNGLEQVRRTAGVSAGAAFYDGLLADGTYISNSEPPCRAIWTAEQLAPDHAYAFADSLPHAFYGDGQALDDPNVLGTLAERAGVAREAFLPLWHSTEAKTGTQQAFAAARAAGVNSYPTLWYIRGDQVSVVASGFAEPQAAAERVRRLRS